MSGLLKIASVLSLGVSVFALPASASAKPISFFYSGTGSGTISGKAFTDAKFVIEAVGDTDDRSATIGAGFRIDHSAASIEIEGFGTFTFLSGTRTFVNNFTNSVGFSRNPQGSDLYNITTSIDFDWDMLENFDLTANGELLQWGSFFGNVLTSGGVLVFNDERGIDGVFKAVVGTPPVIPPVGDVPEPAALGLFGLGLVGLGCMRRRRQA